MIVTLNTSAAGSVSATVQVLLASDGAGTSNLGVTALPTQTIGLSGLITGVVGTLPRPALRRPTPSPSPPGGWGDGNADALDRQHRRSPRRRTQRVDRHGQPGHHGRRFVHRPGAGRDQQHQPGRGAEHRDRRREVGDGDHRALVRRHLQQRRSDRSPFADRQRLGNVFQIAQPTLTSSTINLGSLHVGSTATQPLA